MTKIMRLVIVGLVVLFLAGLLQSGQDEPHDWPQPSAAIFAETAPFEMEIRLDNGRICRNSDKSCPDVPAEISYRGADGSEKRLAASIRTRGRWKTAHCNFPALFVFFEPDQTGGTVFEGETMLPLTTHCKQKVSRYERYVLIEHLAYRLYRLLTDLGLHSRLLQITYVHTDTDRSLKRYGFFTEHFDRLAARTDRVFYRVKILDLYRTVPEEMATLALFQFMIGNLDWSAYGSHNIALFRDPNGITTPVPYDFDYSGLVNAEYAGPPESLGKSFKLRNIRDRLYRGFCWPDLDWPALFDKFQRIRGDIFIEVSATPGLSGRARRDVSKYLESFYGIIDSEKKRRKFIIDKCRKLPAPTH